MFFEMFCKEYQYLNLNPPPPNHDNHHSTTTSPHTLQWITYSESLVRIAAHSWQRCNACIDRTPDWISTENHIPLCEPYCLVGLWGRRRNTWRSCVDAEQWYWDNAGKDSGAIFLLQDLKEREQFWYYTFLIYTCKSINIWKTNSHNLILACDKLKHCLEKSFHECLFVWKCVVFKWRNYSS